MRGREKNAEPLKSAVYTKWMTHIRNVEKTEGKGERKDVKRKEGGLLLNTSNSKIWGQ